MLLFANVGRYIAKVTRLFAKISRLLAIFFYLRKWAFVSTLTYPLYNFIIVFISQTRVLNCSTYKSQHFLSSFVNIFDLDKTQFTIDKKSVILYFNKIARIKMGRIINNLKFTFTFDCACVDDSTLSKNM